MRAAVLLDFRQEFDDGAIVQMVVWKIAVPLKGSAHGFKYRLFYGYPGRRMVCYDNEQGKGDHRHVGSSQLPYRFESIEQLIEDFFDDVTNQRTGMR